jgi:Protein of unknown function (DUF4054)
MPVIPCPSPPPQPVHGIVQFDAPEFVAVWPEFTGLTNGQMSNAFNLATLVLNNSCRSRVGDANTRLTLLYMLTAHVLFLVSGTNDGAGTIVPPPGVVGRIAQAAEGSVSVAAEYSSEVSQSEAWFIQTKYGAMFWQATAQYRTMHYVGAPLTGPNGPGYPFQPWGGAGFGGVLED